MKAGKTAEISDFEKHICFCKQAENSINLFLTRDPDFEYFQAGFFVLRFICAREMRNTAARIDQNKYTK